MIALQSRDLLLQAFNANLRSFRILPYFDSEFIHPIFDGFDLLLFLIEIPYGFFLASEKGVDIRIDGNHFLRLFFGVFRRILRLKKQDLPKIAVRFLFAVFPVPDGKDPSRMGIHRSPDLKRDGMGEEILDCRNVVDLPSESYVILIFQEFFLFQSESNEKLIRNPFGTYDDLLEQLILFQDRKLFTFSIELAIVRRVREDGLKEVESSGRLRPKDDPSFFINPIFHRMCPGHGIGKRSLALKRFLPFPNYGCIFISQLNEFHIPFRTLLCQDFRSSSALGGVADFSYQFGTFG